MTQQRNPYKSPSIMECEMGFERCSYLSSMLHVLHRFGRRRPHVFIRQIHPVSGQDPWPKSDTLGIHQYHH